MDIGPWIYIYIYIDGGQHLTTMDTRLSETGFIWNPKGNGFRLFVWVGILKLKIGRKFDDDPRTFLPMRVTYTHPWPVAHAYDREMVKTSWWRKILHQLIW